MHLFFLSPSTCTAKLEEIFKKAELSRKITPMDLLLHIARYIINCGSNLTIWDPDKKINWRKA